MAAVLTVSTGLGMVQTDGDWRQVIGGLAVMATFLHAQVSDRLREYAAGGGIPPECARMERVYYMGKEVLWLGYFLSMAAYSPIIGTVGFLLYPQWRARHRAGSQSVVPSPEAALEAARLEMAAAMERYQALVAKQQD